MEINFLIQKTYDIIISVIEKSQLPIGIVYYILKDILNNIEKQYYAFLNSQSLNQEQSINFNKVQQEKSSQVSQGQAN